MTIALIATVDTWSTGSKSFVCFNNSLEAALHRSNQAVDNPGRQFIFSRPGDVFNPVVERPSIYVFGETPHALQAFGEPHQDHRTAIPP